LTSNVQASTVSLALDCPEVAAEILSNDVDTRLKVTPPVAPLLPQPHTAKQALVGRIVDQKPLGNALEMVPLDSVVGVQFVDELVERTHEAGSQFKAPTV
jgi:hypothetical protein